MPSRRLATPCRGGNLNLPLQVTSLPSPSLSFLPEPLHRHPTMPCHACSNQFSPCNVVPVCYSRPTIFMFQPPSTMFLVSSSQLLACPPVSLSHTCLRAEQYEPSLASPTTVQQCSSLECRASVPCLPACLPVSLSHTCLRAEQSCRATFSTQPTRILTYPALPCLDHPISNYCTLPCSASPT